MVDEILRWLGDGSPVGGREGVLSFHNEPQHQELLPVPERRKADQKGVQDHPASPRINLVINTFIRFSFLHVVGHLTVMDSQVLQVLRPRNSVFYF